MNIKSSSQRYKQVFTSPYDHHLNT